MEIIIMDSRRTSEGRLVKTYLPRLSTSLFFLSPDEVPATGVDFSADGSSTREGGADPSAALWADLSIGTRRGDAKGAWPASVAGRKAGAADPAPPTSSTTGGGFSPTPPILKDHPLATEWIPWPSSPPSPPPPSSSSSGRGVGWSGPRRPPLHRPLWPAGPLQE